jgi:hypothetical protein
MDHHGDLNVVVSLQQGDSGLQVGISEDLLGNLVPESGYSLRSSSNIIKRCGLHDPHSYFGLTNSRKKLVVTKR